MGDDTPSAKAGKEEVPEDLMEEKNSSSDANSDKGENKSDPALEEVNEVNEDEN